MDEKEIERMKLAEKIISSRPFTWMMAGGDPSLVYVADMEFLKDLYKEWKNLGGKPA